MSDQHGTLLAAAGAEQKRGSRKQKNLVCCFQLNQDRTQRRNLDRGECDYLGIELQASQIYNGFDWFH